MGKLFKLLSLLKFVRELRYTLRGRHGHGGYGHGPGYRRGHPPHGGYGYRRSHGYHPLYGRPRKLKMKHVLRDLIAGRRY